MTDTQNHLSQFSRLSWHSECRQVTWHHPLFATKSNTSLQNKTSDKFWWYQLCLSPPNWGTSFRPWEISTTAIIQHQNAISLNQYPTITRKHQRQLWVTTWYNIPLSGNFSHGPNFQFLTCQTTSVGSGPFLSHWSTIIWANFHYQVQIN